MTDLSTHPTQAASAWFFDFEQALRAQDLEAAMALFDADCYCLGLFDTCPRDATALRMVQA
jgi:hypothetical protein